MQETVGRYRILRPLGRGAMGLVFLAEDPSLNRQVAIKMLDILADSEGDRDFLRNRLLRDAKAAAILSHPNIVSVFDIVEEGNSVYVVMEYIEGESLASYLDSTPVPDPAFTLRLLQQVASGLDYTHTRGVIHRDIKPGNIMIGTGGVVKILDFGIARMSDVRTSTPTGMVMGTVDYMAPEQIKAALIDGRADQFSLAAVAYRMISGSTLFGRHTLATLTYKLVNESPPPVCEKNASIPLAVDHVLSTALAKLPADRYPTCIAFVEALGQAFSGASVLPSPTATLPATPPGGSSTPGKRSKVAAALAGVVLLAGGGAVALWKSSSKPATPPAQQNPAPPAIENAPAAVAVDTEKPAEEPQRPPVKPPVKPSVKPPELPTAKVSVPDASVHTPPAAKQESAAVVTPPVAVKTPEPPEPVMNTPDALPTPLPSSSPAAKETYMHKGMDAMKARDYPEAIRDFSKAVELHPNLIQAYLSRGSAYQDSKQYAQAMQDYSNAIRLGSHDAHAYANRAVCEVRMHDDNLAFTDFNRALELESEFPAALNGRGGILFRRRKYKLAIDDFSAAIRINPKFVQAYQNRANARKATGDLAGAADDYAVIQRLQRNK